MPCVLIVLLLAVMVGCVQPHHVGVNAVIDLPCITGPVKLIDCNMTTPEPLCKSVKVTFKKGCERIVAKGEK